MKLVSSTLKDISTIMKIIGDAQAYLAGLNIDQWQDGYPNEEQIKLDIKNGESYLVVKDEIVIGTTVFTFREEKTYRKIEGGNWITDKESIYGVIHRLAVDEKYRKIGLAKFVFDECEKFVKDHHQAKSLRIDTHRDNIGMQKLLNNRGYQYCGVIILDSGDDRLAYEKIN